MSEHTPGPWRAVARASDSRGQDDYFLGWDIEGPPVAQRGQFERAADARLGAAAPDLLDALVMLMHCGPHPRMGEWKRAIQTAGAAIAKSEGPMTTTGLSAADAIDLLALQVCPVCHERTLIEIECDEDRAVAFESCKNKHLWPYAKFSEDRSTNSFEGTFDPATIDERLEDYCAA